METVYQEALTIEFSERQILYHKDQVLDIIFKGTTINKKYVANFVCFYKISLELKATDILHTEHTALVLNYFKETGLKLALLINFGSTKLQYKIFIL